MEKAIVALILLALVISNAHALLTYVDVQEYIPTEFRFVPKPEKPTPTEKPTAAPTAKPTAKPTVRPTSKPIVLPSPTKGATPYPTAIATEYPTQRPTEIPTARPTLEPTATPTPWPRITPTPEPDLPKTPTGGYLGHLHCSRYMTDQECEDLKEYFKYYARYNFPSSCEGKFSPEYWEVVLYWQIYYESTFNRHASPGTSSSKGLAQFTDGTAQEYHLYDRFNDRENVRAQSEYMRDIANKPWIQCKVGLTLSGFHMGPYGSAIRRGEISREGGQNSAYEYAIVRIMPKVEQTTGITGI